MPPQPPLPKTGANNAGEQAAGRVINSNTGWNSLTNSLGTTVPRNISHARRATAGLHTLIRTGR